MSIKAAGYVLHVPPDRRELLLEEAEHGGSYYRSAPSVAEPVATFQHSRRAPLVVFASFEDGKVTHIANGKRGISAGTGLARLNMQDLKPLARPIGFDELQSGVPKRLQTHLKRVLTGRRHSSAKNPRGIRRPNCGTRCICRPPIGALFSASPKKPCADLGRAPRNISRFKKRPWGSRWRSAAFPETSFWNGNRAMVLQQSFLDGLPGVQVREDTMLLADFSTVPGFRDH